MPLKDNWVAGDTVTHTHLNDVATTVNGLTSVPAPAAAAVLTAESTSSTSYIDLATTTDTITVTVGPSGMVQLMMSMQVGNNFTGINYMTFAASGSNTIAASDDWALIIRYSSASSVVGAAGVTYLLTGLAQGSTTFKLKYKTSSNTATFSDRRIAAIPL